MDEPTLYGLLLRASFIVAVVVFLLLFFVSAPYGRHARVGWGVSLSDRAGWIVMEAPAALVFGILFTVSDHLRDVTAWSFFGLWELHYVYRSFIYPFRRRAASRRMPLAVVALGFLFNGSNAYLNGRFLFQYSGGYAAAWLTDPRFIVGVALFAGGLLMNRQADQILRDVRRPGAECYSIPEGGMFSWVSCPNYLGEVIQWLGWAVLTWSLAGLSFAIWTAANLVPRARAHHAWYQQQFIEYPPERKALVPRLW